MSSLKRIRMVNVQSHVDTTIDLPERGIVRFYGDNSNGKSVFVKALWDILSGRISQPKYRDPLIRRGCQFCEVTFSDWENREILAHIHHEAAQTFVELREPGKQPVRRYNSDRNFNSLLSTLGFHYNSEFKISVNIHRDDDPLLFTSTPHKVNYALMDSAMSDEFAECALQNMSEILPELRQIIKQTENNKLVKEASLKSLAMYEKEKETARMNELTWLANNIEALNLPYLSDVPAVPKITIQQLLPTLPNIPYPKIYEAISLLAVDLTSVAQEIKQLKDNTCPMCGRTFV